VGSPDLADREQAWMAECSEVVTAWSATVTTPGTVAVVTYREEHNQ